jgi:hypothetical protein
MVGVPLLSANAGAIKKFSVSPYSGARTGAVTLTSDSPCTNGETQAHVHAISHPAEATERIEVTDFPIPVDEHGNWTTSLDYFRAGPTGFWEIQAGCGGLEAGTNYGHVGFVVYETTWSLSNIPSPSPSASASTLPSPSAPPSPEALPATAVSGNADFTG